MLSPESVQCCIPDLAYTVPSITFTAEGNPSTRPSPLNSNLQLINFDRYVKLSRIVNEFSRYQQPFNLAILQDVQNWLTAVLAEKGSGSVDALYRKSRESRRFAHLLEDSQRISSVYVFVYSDA